MPGCSLCKEIIDNQHGLVRVLGCMSTSILLAADGGSPLPTAAMAADFKAKADALALCASGIEAYVNPPASSRDSSGKAV